MSLGDIFSAQTYVTSTGEDLYRRSMYTFWKRTVPPAALATFDAPDREKCTTRRARTNTPLQALALMNDTTYVEASRALAEKMIQAGGEDAVPRDLTGKGARSCSSKTKRWSAYSVWARCATRVTPCSKRAAAIRPSSCVARARSASICWSRTW